MTKTGKIIVAIIAMLLIAGGWYYANKNKVGTTTPEQPTQNAALNPVSGQTISEKLPKTNPFETSVNPYDAYKNPFNK